MELLLSKLIHTENLSVFFFIWWAMPFGKSWHICFPCHLLLFFTVLLLTTSRPQQLSSVPDNNTLSTHMNCVRIFTGFQFSWVRRLKGKRSKTVDGMIHRSAHQHLYPLRPSKLKDKFLRTRTFYKASIGRVVWLLLINPKPISFGHTLGMYIRLQRNAKQIAECQKYSLIRIERKIYSLFFNK